MSKSDFNTFAGILIPTYNRKELLKQALASVLGQSSNSFEIIVIDNGSTDGTAEFMAEIKDLRLRYVVNAQNIGLIGSINKGIRLFSTKVRWCTILGDDDLLDCRFLELIQEVISGDTTLKIVQGHRIFIDSAGKIIRDAVRAPETQTAIEYLEARSQFRQESFLTGIVFSRQGFEEVGGYPNFITGMATDDAFIFALALKDKLYCCKDAVAYVRMHENAESHETHGMVKHIRALYDFRRYVDKTAEQSGQFEPDALKRISTMAAHFAKCHNSGFWLKNVLSIIEKGTCEYKDELRELYSLAGDDRYQYNLRVSIDLFCIKYFGYCPEHNRLYRSIQDACEKILGRFAK